MGNKTLTYGNVDMLVLKLLENQDMYGYQIGAVKVYAQISLQIS